jgi:hypothetical protein
LLLFFHQADLPRTGGSAFFVARLIGMAWEKMQRKAGKPQRFESGNL